VTNGATTTIYGQTLPGAVCTSRVRYANGRTPTATEFFGGAQTALQDGFVVFPLTVNTSATSADAVITCRLGGQTLQTTTTITVASTGTPTTP
jgi:hypothetical protein